MIKNLKRNKILWLLIALMALIASLIGIAYQGVYQNLTVLQNLPAILSQDLITVLASITILVLIIRIKESDFAKQLILLGIIGYLFYVYGIYVLGKFYNPLYLLYMAIFSLSFFSLVYGIANIRNEAYAKIKIPTPLQKVSAAFLFLIPIIFYPMWIISMWPFMQEMRVPVVNSNIYILDICFVLPVFAMMAVMLLKREKFAILLTPVLLIKGFTLCLSVALTEYLRPFYNQTWIKLNAFLFSFLALASLVLALLYFKKALMNHVPG
jgi:hypothetical protein